jgi:hypothetical protein
MDKSIIKERREVEVWGSFLLTTQNMAYEPIGRDGMNTTPHLIPFEFHIALPYLRKARVILRRNELGQIQKAQA